jgi:translation initiation factor 1A
MSEGEILRIRLPKKGKGEILGVVESMLGANRLRVKCLDGKTRMGRIRGKMRKRVWIREGDIIIAVPWQFQDEKADICFRYTSTQVAWLKRKGFL